MDIKTFEITLNLIDKVNKSRELCLDDWLDHTETHCVNSGQPRFNQFERSIMRNSYLAGYDAALIFFSKGEMPKISEMSEKQAETERH